MAWAADSAPVEEAEPVPLSVDKAAGVLAGIPDLAVAWPFGRIGFLELKIGRNDETPAQKAMLDRLRRYGFPVAVVRSVDEALDALRSWGAPINGKVAA